MRDYSKSKEGRSVYIKKYYILGPEIITCLANGTKYVTWNSPETEAEIINRMEIQARFASVKQMSKIEKVLAVSQPAVLPIAIMNFVRATDAFTALILIIVGVTAVFHPLQYLIYKLKSQDVNKLNYFIDNKDGFSLDIKNNENLISGLSKRAIKQLNSKPLNCRNQGITINDIDNYSLKDLRTIKENISREYEFGFNEFNYHNGNDKKNTEAIQKKLKLQ